MRRFSQSVLLSDAFRRWYFGGFEVSLFGGQIGFANFPSRAFFDEAGRGGHTTAILLGFRETCSSDVFAAFSDVSVSEQMLLCESEYLQSDASRSAFLAFRVAIKSLCDPCPNPSWKFPLDLKTCLECGWQYKCPWRETKFPRLSDREFHNS